MTTVRINQLRDQERLPVGSTVNYDGRTHWYTATGDWISATGTAQPAMYFNGGNEVTLSPVPYRQETLEQFRQRLATTLRGLSQAHGTGYADALAIIRAMGIPTPVPSVGQVVHPRDALAMGTLPEEAILIIGHPNTGLYSERRKGGEHIMGMTVPEHRHTLWRVGQLPEEVDDWGSLVGTEADAAAILTLKQQLWVEGRKAKDRHRWCGTFEMYMSVLLVDDRIGDPPDLLSRFPVVGRTARNALADGAIVAYPSGGDATEAPGVDWEWLVKVGGTYRHLIGPSNDPDPARVQVLHNPADGDLMIPTHTRTTPLVPVGTRVIVQPGTDEYRKQEMGQWIRHIDGGYNHRDFYGDETFANGWFYTHIPTT